MNLTSEAHTLECRGLTYMSTLADTGSLFSRIYRPPLVAQFLKEVSLIARSGEVHGIVGVAGCGKTTLLEAIAARAQGDIGGTVLLDKHLLTASRFSKLCVFVSFRTRYPGHLSVRSTLFYHARLSIGGPSITSEDIDRAVDESMDAFDLLAYAHDRMCSLSESARRRTILALQLISDPLLVVVDDLLRDLDPLPSFQITSCLSSWAKKRNRIVLISMRTPRSDIYQLLNRLTILYYGEIFYSGYTKQLPAYFKQAGFTCPNNENPAVYYLSLATVDRETAERYAETQEQATKLVEYFKVHSVTPREGDLPKDAFGLSTVPIGTSVALCYLERPSNASKFVTLIRRTLSMCVAQWPIFLCRLILLSLLFFGLLSTIGFSPSPNSPSLLFSAAGVVHLLICVVAGTSVFLAYASFEPLRTLCYIESTEGVYNGVLVIVAYLLVHVPVEALSVGLAVSLWLAGPNSTLYFTPSSDLIVPIVSTMILLMLTSLFTHVITLFFLATFRSSLTTIALSFSIIVAGVIHAGGFLRHIPAPSSIFITLPTYANIFHYISHGLTVLLVPLLSPVSMMRNCTRNERQEVDLTKWKEFCRWHNSTTYLAEVYPDDNFEASNLSQFPLSDVLFSFVIVIIVLSFTLVIYALPKPRCLTDQFKYT